MKLSLTFLIATIVSSAFAGDRKLQTDVAYGEHDKQKLDLPRWARAETAS